MKIYTKFLSTLLFAGALFLSFVGYAQPTFTIQNVKGSCEGFSNGSFEILVTAATGNVSVFYFGPPSGGPISATVGVPILVSGLPGAAIPGKAYLVVVQDDIGPTNTSVSIVSYPTLLSASIDAIVNNSSCNTPNGSINITPTGGSGAPNYTFSWDGPNGFTSTTEDISGLAGGDYEVTIFDSNTNCTETLPPITITDPSPFVFNVTTSSALNVCAGSGWILNQNGSEVGVTYELIKNNVIPTGIIQLGTGAPISFSIPSGSFVNGDNFKVLATNGFCTPVEMNFAVVITIVPLPTAATSGGGTVCAGDPLPSVTFTFTGTPPFNFTYFDGATSFPIVGHNSTVFTIPVATAGTYSVTNLSDANGCIATSLGGSVQVIVNPLPTAVISASPSPICSGQSSTLTFTLTGTAPFAVSYNDGTTTFNLAGISTGHTVSVSPTANTTYTIVSVSDATTCNGVGGSATTVNVNIPPSSAALVGTATICAGQSTNLSVNIVGGLSPYSFTIDNGVGLITNYTSGSSISVSPAANTTYTITGNVTDAAGCTVTPTGSAIVTVNPVPTATISASPSPICSGQSSTLTFTLTGTAPFAVSYNDGTTTFNLAGISTGHTVSVSPTANTTYTIVSVSDATTCNGVGGSATTVNVNIPPSSATLVGTATICAGQSTNLSVNIVGGLSPYSFTIDNGVGLITNYTSGSSISVSPAANTTYTITGNVTDAAGCTVTPTGSAIVTVNPVPTATISASPSPICSGQSSTLTFTLTGTAPFAVSYNDGTTTFNLAGISTGHTVSVSPTANTTYTIVSVSDATTCNGVGGSATTVNVNIPPSSATLVGTATICAGQSTNLSVNIVGGLSPYSFTIDNGVGLITNYTSGSSISVSPAANTTYTITGNVTDAAGCTVTPTGSAIVTVNPVPTATISASPSPICSGQSSTLTFTLTGTAPFAVSYNDGTTTFNLAGISTGHTVSVSPTANTTYTIVSVSDATTCNGVGGSATTVNVNIPPSSAALVGTATICAGQSTNLSVNIVGGLSPYSFTIDNGVGLITNYTSGSSISVSPAANTTYTITGNVTDAAGCTVTPTGSAIVTVNPVPTATISASPSPICSGQSSTLTFTLTGTAPFAVSYNDGTTTFNLAGISTGHTVSVSPTTNTTYTIVSVSDATTCNGVGGSAATVNVTPVPTAIVSASPSPICSGQSSTLTFTLTGTGPFDVSYNDGTTTFNLAGISTGHTVSVSPVANTTYTIVSVDDATICTGTGGSATTVTVVPLPIAVISASPSPICSGQSSTLTFTLTGTGPFDVSYSDGTTTFNLTGINTGHTVLVSPTLNTTYSIVSVDDATICSGAPGSTTTVTVNAAPTATLAASPTPICSGDNSTLTFTLTGTGPFDVSYSDGTTTFNLTGINTGHNFNVFPVATTTYTITSVTDAICAGLPGGAATVTVNNSPTAAALLGTTTICAGSTTNLSVTITGGLAPYTFTIDNGVGVVANYNSGDLISVSPGVNTTYSIVGNVQDAAGCAVTPTGSAVITVNPAATADAGPAQIICSTGTVTLAGVIGGSASSGTWTGGAGTFAPDANTLNAVYTPSAAEVTAGTVSLVLTTNDPDGVGPCTAAVDNVVITISSGATVGAGPAQTICAGNTVTLAGTFTGAAGILWTTAGDGTFSDATLTNAVYTPGVADVAAGTVILTITTGGPCAPVAANVTITINTVASVDAGSPQTICSGSTVTLSGSFGGSATGVLWTTAGDGTFSDNTDINAIYTPGVNDITAGSAVLTITATGTCLGVTDNVTITINPAATVDAGLPQTICSGTVTLAGTFGGSAASVTWTTSGDGTFNNASLPGAIYTPGTNDIATGNVTLTLTTNNPAGPCPVAVDNVLITITPIAAAPTPGIDTWIGEVFTDAGPPVSAADFAASKYRGFINATDIDNTAVSSTYDVTTDEFDLNFTINAFLQAPLAGSNICGSYSNNYSIRLRMQKTLPAGIYSVTVGSDDGVRLIVNGTTIINQFNDHSYTTFPGSFCSTGAGDDFIIEYYERGGQSRVSFDYQLAPAPTVTTPVAVCVGTATAPTLTATSSDASVTSFNWYSDAALTNQVGTGLTFTPTVGTGTGELDLSTVASTSYFVTSDYTTCESAASVIVIDVVNGATITVINPTICESNGPIDLTPFVTTTPIGGTLTFTSPNVTGSNFDPTGLSGTFVVDVDYGILTCVAPTTQMTVTVTNNSVVTVPAAATTICQNNPIIDLTTLVSAVPAGGTFTFSNSAAITGNNFDPSLVTGPQTINVDYDFGAGSCAAPQTSFTINVQVNATVTTSNTTVCPAGGNVNLLPLVSGTPSGGVFTFSGTDVTGNSFNPSAHAGTTVPVTVLYDAGGCTQVSGTIQITVRGAADPICVGGGVNCFAFATSDPVIETRPTCANQNDGQLIFGVKGGTGTYVITLYDSVSVPIFTQAKIGSSATPIVFNSLSPSLTYFYKIDDGINTCTLPYSLPVQTTVTASATSFTNAQCFGEATGSVVINASGSQTGQYFYSIDNGVNWTLFTPGNVISGLPPNGTYNVLVGESTNDACVAAVSVTINNANPDLQIGTTITGATCNNDDGMIVITPPTAPNIGGGGPYQYALNDGTTTGLFQTSTTFDELPGGIYSILVQDGLGCVKTITPVNVTFPGFVNFTITASPADCTNNGLSGSITVDITDIGGVYKVALATDTNEPDAADYIDYSEPSITFPPLARGTYFVFVQSQTASCPTRSTAITIGGSYAMNFTITPQCENNQVSVILTDITGEPNIPIELTVFDKELGTQVGFPIPLGIVPATGDIRLDYNDPRFVFLQIPGKEYEFQVNQIQSTFCQFFSPFVDFTTTRPVFARAKPRTSKDDGESYPDEFTGVMTIIDFDGGLTPYEVRIEMDSASVPSQNFETDFEEVQKNSNLQFEQVYENIPAGRYVVQVRDSIGCVLEFNERVPLDIDLFVPNIITPNGDARNDMFVIRNLPAANSKLIITDRWGVSVFSTNSYQNDWSGGDVADGVYYYTLNTGKDTRKGWIEVKKEVKP